MEAMPVLGWEQMRLDAERRLLRDTGAGIAEWARRSRQAGADDEAALRAWLGARGVHGYGQMFVVMERFGYPDFLTATPDALIDAQYADRAALRPVLDAVLLLAGTLPGTVLQARKGYVSLVARRQYAVVRASTRTRVDLGVRLDGEGPGGRLLAARSLANASINLRVPLSATHEVDDEVGEILARAHAQAS